MKRSLLTGFLPLPFGISVHISLTSAESHQYIAFHYAVRVAHSPIRDCYACQTPLLEQAISAHFVKRRGSGCDSLRLSGVRTEGHCSALRWYTVSYLWQTSVWTAHHNPATASSSPRRAPSLGHWRIGCSDIAINSKLSAMSSLVGPRCMPTSY